MISQLTVKDYILFEKAIVDFEEGMTVITGETGAGKSLLIDALGYLCGGRIPGNIIRKGADKAILQLVYDNPSSQAQAFLEEQGIEPEEQIIITRTVSETKSTVRINGQAANLSTLKALSKLLLDIHSQTDTITLMDPKVQLALLDEHAGAMDQREKTANAYQAYFQAVKALEKAKTETYSDDELDFVTHQINEIDGIQAKEGELEQLQADIKEAERSAKSEEEFHTCLALLKKEGGLLDGIYTLSKVFKKSPQLQNYANDAQDMYYTMQDWAEQIEFQSERLQDQSAKLDQMQSREYQLKKMYRRYGGSYAAMMEKKQSLESKVERILHREDLFERLKKAKDAALTAYETEANLLRSMRQASLSSLEAAILSHCKDLMLEHARFKIDMQEKAPSADGSDTVTFLASMNPGQPLTSLKLSASGGELSRLMLALKTVFQTEQGIDTIVFDEIDTGVSGKVALAMGSKMHAISQNRQVLCITHLASVAVWADDHYRVSKTTDGQTTTTFVERLDQERKEQELAIMAYGSATKQGIEGMRQLRESVCG